MFSKRNFHEKSHSTSKVEMLSFPVGSADIFSFLSEMPLIDLLQHVEGKKSNGLDWDTFRPVCSKYSSWLDSNDYIQFLFSTFQIEIQSYQIKTTFQKWSLFASHDSIQWIPIHYVHENANFASQTFRLQNLAPFSFLQIKNEGEDAILSEFEIFGNLKKKENFVHLKSLTKGIMPALNPQSIYSFSLQQDWGLISFLLSMPSKEVFFNFEIFGYGTSSNSSIFNLVTKDESNWISKDEERSRIEIRFWKDWRFHPTAFKLKSGFRFYPKSWEIIGSGYSTLAEFKGEERLSSPFAERVFPLRSNEYFWKIELIQTGPNSERNSIFCLSQIEIYGELKHL
jgi:hypothetical protein